jgi:catechol 2,3-dioxygenase-like lactoylglutathione lyase family enzyme
MRPQPLIVVSDVEASSRWYERLLGCQGSHGGSEYQRLVTPDGVLIMQLHSFEAEHHHGAIANPADKPYGNGVLLWFEIDDFDAAMERVAEMRPEIVIARHVNPKSEPLGMLAARSRRLYGGARQSRQYRWMTLCRAIGRHPRDRQDFRLAARLRIIVK